MRRRSSRESGTIVAGAGQSGGWRPLGRRLTRARSTGTAGRAFVPGSKRGTTELEASGGARWGSRGGDPGRRPGPPVRGRAAHAPTSWWERVRRAALGPDDNTLLRGGGRAHPTNRVRDDQVRDEEGALAIVAHPAEIRAATSVEPYATCSHGGHGCMVRAAARKRTEQSTALRLRHSGARVRGGDRIHDGYVFGWNVTFRWRRRGTDASGKA